MYDEYETFHLIKELTDNSIPVGTLGVVLMVLDNDTYEVEFPDGKGGNLGKDMTYTITECFMKRTQN